MSLIGQRQPMHVERWRHSTSLPLAPWHPWQCEVHSGSTLVRGGCLRLMYVSWASHGVLLAWSSSPDYRLHSVHPQPAIHSIGRMAAGACDWPQARSLHDYQVICHRVTSDIMSLLGSPTHCRPSASDPTSEPVNAEGQDFLNTVEIEQRAPVWRLVVVLRRLAGDGPALCRFLPTVVSNQLTLTPRAGCDIGRRSNFVSWHPLAGGMSAHWRVQRYDPPRRSMGFPRNETNSSLERIAVL
ncbi:hypothetical protein LIA77_09745 [Sarocladium implicatum]|nr:hypothetical protein LIA77_09745 [Sarocladium implicatum]